jgi:hypothetical protein
LENESWKSEFDGNEKDDELLGENAAEGFQKIVYVVRRCILYGSVEFKD